MHSLLFSNRERAQAIADRIDAALGFPRDGVDRGDGRHAPHAATRTLTYAALRAHPARAEWAYPVDALVEPFLSQTERAAVIALPADWFPPVVDFTNPLPSPPSTH